MRYRTFTTLRRYRRRAIMDSKRDKSKKLVYTLVNSPSISREDRDAYEDLRQFMYTGHMVHDPAFIRNLVGEHHFFPLVDRIKSRIIRTSPSRVNFNYYDRTVARIRAHCARRGI